jgi:hypothetical protein
MIYLCMQVVGEGLVAFAESGAWMLNVLGRVQYGDDPIEDTRLETISCHSPDEAQAMTNPEDVR